jgi:hypothetical protein
LFDNYAGWNLPVRPLSISVLPKNLFSPHMSNVNETNTNTPEADAEGSCSCGCGCETETKGCALCPGEKTLAFWILRLWLGFRALFTGFSKFTRQEEGSTASSAGSTVTTFLKENYGSVAANKAVETSSISDIASAAAVKAVNAAGATSADAFTAAYNAALPEVAKSVEAASTAAAAAVKTVAAVATSGADTAAAAAATPAASATSKLIHHGLPQGGDWTLDGFLKADIWYMPEWALRIFDGTLGYILIALGVTLLLGIGTRLSLFIQGLLYAGLTLGFIAISKEPGSSAGITMLGVHIALVVVALLLAKYTKLAVLKKF